MKKFLVIVAIIAAMNPAIISAQTYTPPPGMILVDCPVRPAPWQVPGVAGHPGFDLQRDPSSSYNIVRGVPEQCIDYPGGSQHVYHQIIGLKVYKPRYGTDPGSQTGTLASAVVICDLSGCGAHNAGSSPDQEWWRSGQDWRSYVSPNGRWLYSVQGGLSTNTCDVNSQPDWRRWLVLVQERDLLSCLNKIWARGGTLGMPITPTPVPTQVATPVPAVVSTPMPPVTQPSALEQRVANLEQRQQNTENKLDQILDILKATPTPRG